jgi:protein phosphatase
MTATRDLAGQYDTFGATHVGRVRKVNEDSFLVRPEAGIWAVADGMGGHAGGEFASAAVVEALEVIAPQPHAPALLTACMEALAGANGRIRRWSAGNGGATVGTTVVTLLVFDDLFTCLWSGDSRVYCARDRRIVQLSRDHTEAESLVASGLLTPAEARSWPRRNVVTRAVGVFEEPMLEREAGTLKPGDVFILCSDGLTDHVEPEEILDAVTRQDAAAACRTLVDLTLERGAVDNVTVVVMRYRPDNAAADGSPADPRRSPWE